MIQFLYLREWPFKGPIAIKEKSAKEALLPAVVILERSGRILKDPISWLSASFQDDYWKRLNSYKSGSSQVLIFYVILFQLMSSDNSTQLINPAKLGIIGYGIVGQALAFGFSQPEIKDKYEIRYYDRYKDTDTLEDVATKSEFIFICLPTPMREDESGIDLSIIEEMVGEITKYTDNTDKIIVIKSTVVPGTTARLEKKHPKSNFAFNPEFLTEANYLEDFVNADRNIVGANNDLTSRRVVALYLQRFPHTKIYQTDSTTAEMVKYMANAFLATKVIFANETYNICQALGIKYEEVKSMVVGDHRIFDSHLDVTTARGFGGKCFPKDIVALIGRAKDLKIDPNFLETVWTINKKIRKVKDWEEIPFAVEGNHIKK